MACAREEEAVTDLLDIKSKLEDSLTELQDEKESIKKKISALKEQKDNFRKEKNDQLQKLYKLRIELVDVNKRVKNDCDHILKISQIVANIENGIHNMTKLEDFEDKVLKLQSSIESAINFYSEDSLQMELMKRTNNVREQRVAYTKAESDYNELVRRIEEEKREKERVRLAQEERERLEEEERKRREEEIILAEEAKRRENFRRSRSEAAVDTAQPPFLEKIHPPVSSIELNKSSDPRDDQPMPESEASAVDIPKTKSIFPETFSQLLRW